MPAPACSGTISAPSDKHARTRTVPQPPGIEVHPGRAVAPACLFPPRNRHGAPFAPSRTRSARPWFICTMSPEAFCRVTRSAFPSKPELSTRVQVTSVGATRIYRQRAGRATARLSTSIRVGDGAMLEYLARCHHSVLRLALQSIDGCFTRPECRIHRVGNRSRRPHRQRRGVRIRFLSFRMQRFAPALARSRWSAIL